MSKTVKKIAAVGLAVAGFFFPVAAPFLRAAALGLWASASVKKPQASASFGSEVLLDGDPIGVREIVYGEAWTGGYLRFRQATGTNNNDFYMVIVLAGHEIDSVQAATADGEALTLDGSGNVTNPTKWAGLMNVRYYLGTDSQTADSTLDTAFSEWTSSHRLRGCAYAIVKLTFDETNMNTLPAFRFKIRGRKVYDPRLDSTNGGSGSHRLATPSTWAWSRNAELCKNDFLRGVYINSIRIAGLGLDSARFNWANVIAEANVCDESVSLAAGGNQKRYTVDGIIDPRQEPGVILRMFDLAMAGDTVPSDGKWRSFAGAYRTPTVSLTQQHFVGPLRHVVHKGEMDRFDTAEGRFVSLADNGNAISYSPVELSTVTIGEPRFQTIDLQLVSDSTNTDGVYDGGARAQRIAKLLLEKQAAGKQITCTTNLHGLQCMPGETVSITHSAFGLSSQTMRVIEVGLRAVSDERGRQGLVVDLTLEAGPSSLYTWSAEETAIVPVAELPQNVVPPITSADGDTVARARIYQRASSTPTLPSATVTYTFATGGMTGLNNGWTATIPAGTDPLYISEASAVGTGSTDTIASGEWTSPVILVQNGATGSTGSPGADGINSATVFLYQRATSTPSVPGSTLTYTFSTGVLSGTLGSWTQSVPSGTDPIYIITATALSTSSTDTIATGEWATPRILAQNGANGTNGTNGSNGSNGLDAGNWVFTGGFSATDADTVAWGTGTLKDTSGNSYSITGSNTGNMSAVTYIYWDPGVSTTAFQTTTTATSAVGSGKIIIAVAQNATTGASAFVHAFSGAPGSLLVTGDQIVANAITAAKMAASLVFTNTLQLSSTGNIQSGKTSASDTTKGVWIGSDGSGNPDLHIGDATSYLWFDYSASSLKASGDIQLAQAETSTTPSWTSGWSSAPTGNMYYRRSGNLVFVRCDSACYGTSNSGNFSFSMGGSMPLPAAQRQMVVSVYNQGSLQPATLTINTDGTCGVVPYTGTAGGFSGSGNKGFTPGSVFVYSVD